MFEHHKKPKKSKHPRPRLIPRDGDYEIVRIGHRRLLFHDLYAYLLAMPWLPLLLMIAAFYFLSNLTFAEIYYQNRDGIENAHDFGDMFFFSVQTMATIGYGKMTPVSILANLVVSIEALWGFAFFAFVTALMFAKFSRPTAHVLFSDVAVISDFDGTPHLKIRLANQRTNRIVDANTNMFLLRTVTTKEGYKMRRFFDLPLQRSHVPLMQLSWTLLHEIDENSPLFGVTHEQMMETEDEVIVALVGLDETMSQTIHARHSYVAEEIIRDAFFEDILTRHDGHIEVNYNLFNSLVSAKKDKSGLN